MTIASERQEPAASVRTALVIHPDDETRAAIAKLLRGGREEIAIFEAAGASAALSGLADLAPNVVFVDLDSERELGFECATQARSAGSHVIGTFNPLLVDAKGDFYRVAARAGVSDFVPTPVSGAELQEALAAVPSLGEGRTSGRLVTCFSHKGGSGTTTLAVNLALALAAANSGHGEVALVDSDLPFGMAAAHLGLAPTRTLSDLIAELDSLTTLSPYLAEHPDSGLRVLASPRDPRNSVAISPAELGRALVALKQRFEFVVVDGPSHLDLLAFTALDLADEILVVVEPTSPAVLASSRMVRLLETEGLSDRLHVVLNISRDFDDALSDDLVAEQLGRTVDVVLPYENYATLASHTGVPLFLARQNSEFSDVITHLAESIASGRTARQLAR